MTHCNMPYIGVHLRLYLGDFKTCSGLLACYVLVCKTLELTEGVFSFYHDCMCSGVCRCLTWQFTTCCVRLWGGS